MEIRMECGCGASFHSVAGSYMNLGGKPDEKGRVFVVQVQADRWLEDHKRCQGGVEDEKGDARGGPESR